jgi:uncharacterized protein YceK
MAQGLRTLSLTVWAVSSLAGCGTLLNMQDEPPGMFWWDLGTEIKAPDQGTPTRRVYGGVAYDAFFGAGMLQASFRSGEEFAGSFGFAWGAYVLGIDLPLTVAGDTLTLPWTAAATVERWLGYPIGYRRSAPLWSPAADEPASLPVSPALTSRD